MLPPYHGLQRCGDKLAAASASRIDIFNLADGQLLSTWNCPKPTTTVADQGTPEAEELDTPATPTAAAIEPPAAETSPNEPATKRRKLSDSEEAPTQDGKSKRMRPTRGGSSKEPEIPFVTTMIATKDGKHLIAVTGEDKSIRVFRLTERGTLLQLSERAMPKRPCSLALAVNETTILSADKFGDVYSLPLFPPEEVPESRESSVARKEVKTYVPAATTLTVHSKRNRIALESQLKLANRQTEKTGPDFEHKLELGHVSMLTEVAVAEFEGRSYILTADRDEHIRVSRSIPQAHIIEGFCLGHDEFVSALCLPSSHDGLLISGGGDDELFLWIWPTGELLQSCNLRNLIYPSSQGNGESNSNGLAENETDGTLRFPKLAVSVIIHLTISNNVHRNHVFVTCEGIPKLLVFALSDERELSHLQSIELEGNPLAMSAGTNGELIVSIDYLHESGPSKGIRNVPIERTEYLQTFESRDGAWEKRGPHFKIATEGNAEDIDASKGRLTNLFYGLESLRKRDGEE